MLGSRQALRIAISRWKSDSASSRTSESVAVSTCGCGAGPPRAGRSEKEKEKKRWARSARLKPCRQSQLPWLVIRHCQLA